MDKGVLQVYCVYYHAMKFLGFVATFVCFFALSIVFLAAVDALPEPIGGAQEPVREPIAQAPQSNLPANAELPVRVAAADIGLDITVLNTQSTDIAALDADLLKGAVRHPTSAELGVKGTMLLFGHSSRLPIVRNQNYKAFNDIEKLKEGQVVSVYSGTREYRYTVTGVRLADAEDDVIPLKDDTNYLVLVTCNTFAAKTARYVVEAKLQDVRTLQ